MPEPSGALAGIKVLDLLDERAIYGAKLLADLGADVLRPEPPGGDPLRRRGPYKDDVPGPTNSLWHAFYASNRRFVTLDPAADDSRRRLNQLVAWADVVLDGGTLAAAGLDPDSLLERHPALVLVEVSSFGPSGPWRDYLAPDLVASALGGVCATTGDVDTPPLKGYGEAAFHFSGSYAAIAALAALRHVREQGEGQRVEVNVHECIASCLEHVLMWRWYNDALPMARTPSLPRRGSLHWSNAYVVVEALDGAIMITPTPDVGAQIAWLIEEDAAEELLAVGLDEEDSDVSLAERALESMRPWAAAKRAKELFFEAQGRHCPFGLVQSVDQIAENPQLEARGWWRDFMLGDSPARGPGPPFQIDRGPGPPSRVEEKPDTRPYTGPGADTEAVLAEIGWEA